MLTFDHFHIAAPDGSKDPLLHGIARGIARACPVPAHDDLPDGLGELLARLAAVDADADEAADQI